MNFLAHAYLSFDQPRLVVGNYLGDFVSNRQLPNLHRDIRDGVKLHRAIDQYTDRHPIVKQGTAHLHEHFGKYSPVVLDIYFDFLLSKLWPEYHTETLTSFCVKTYQYLRAHQHEMPEIWSQRMLRMTDHRWLENYQTYEGLDRVFRYLAKKAKFPSNLALAADILPALEDHLELIFVGFFPQLIAFSHDHVAQLIKMEKLNQGHGCETSTNPRNEMKA